MFLGCCHIPSEESFLWLQGVHVLLSWKDTKMCLSQLLRVKEKDMLFSANNCFAWLLTWLTSNKYLHAYLVPSLWLTATRYLLKLTVFLCMTLTTQQIMYQNFLSWFLSSSFELSQSESQFLLLLSYQMNAQLIWYNNFSKFCLLYCVGY